MHFVSRPDRLLGGTSSVATPRTKGKSCPIQLEFWRSCKPRQPERTAVILPESGIRITYKSLRRAGDDHGGDLAALGIRRGDRVATVLPNGLPAIVTFLAASIAGTAAPLNPGYRQDEFSFYLDDTAAKLLLCPPDGAAEARASRAKEKFRSIPCRWTRADSFASWTRRQAHEMRTRPRPDDVALVLHTSGSTGRPKRVPIRHAISPRPRTTSRTLRAHAGRCLAVRDAAVSCSRPGGVDALDVSLGRHGGGAGQVQPAFVLAHRARHRRHLVFRRAHHSPASARARGRRTAGGSRRPALHPLLQRGAASGDDAEHGERLRRAGARSLRHDRSFAPDVLQSAAAQRAQAGFGRAGHRRQDQHHGRRGQSSRQRRARRSRDPGSERGPRIREQSGGQCEILHQRLVPHRRSGLSRRGRLS